MHGLIVACEQEEKDEAAEHNGFFQMLGVVMKAIEVRVTGIAGRDAVNGSARRDAILLHLRNDAELRKSCEPEHDDGDENGGRTALAENSQGPPDGEQENDDRSGRESFIVQHAETFRDDGSGGVGIGDRTERSPGSDGEKEKTAEPDDQSQPDDGAEQGFHARQGTAEGGTTRRLITDIGI